MTLRANRIPHVRLCHYVRFEAQSLEDWWRARLQGPVRGSYAEADLAKRGAAPRKRPAPWPTGDNGRWRQDGRRVNRRVGPKRAPGAAEGLTRKQAEAELRELIGTYHVWRPLLSVWSPWLRPVGGTSSTRNARAASPRHSPTSAPATSTPDGRDRRPERGVQ